MRDTDMYTELLEVAFPWRVARVDMDAKEERVTVRVELEPGGQLACPQCGRTGCTIKDRRERTWRHLNTCKFKTFVKGPLPRVDCPECGVKTFTPPWAERYSRFTKEFEGVTIKGLLEMSVTGACRLLGITWDEADSIMARAVRRGLQRQDLSQLRRIGIDEKAVRKGHHYVTIVYNLDTSDVVWVGEDRKEETLDGFFASLPKQVLSQIECIAMDMWAPYRASCRNWIADADEKTVLDRFHIEGHLNQAVDSVRKDEHRALQEEGIDLLSRTKWDWLYRPENLPPERELRFNELRQFDLKTVRAHAIKENFRHFWRYTYTGNARRFFKGWYFWATHSQLPPVIKAAKRLNRHLDRILTYFRLRASNSIAEGINNKIGTVNKKAYGFRNVSRYINAIYFHCAGLELDPP
jgi:transposase